jgi:hypothetical protein
MEDDENRMGASTVMERDSDDGHRRKEKSAAALAPPLPTEAHGRIGRHLRKIYGDMLAEPMPDKFGKLLDELADSERSQ